MAPLSLAASPAAEAPRAAAALASAAAPSRVGVDRLVELPACAACLDRLDGSVSGVAGPGVCSHQSLMVDLARGAQHCRCWAALNPVLCPTCKALHTYTQDGPGDPPAGSSSASAGSGGEAPGSGGFSEAAPPPLGGQGAGHGAGCPKVACAECGARSRLWACLVCGFVGCGRYTAEHSLRHSRASGHRWAVELESRRVWDYFEDT